MNRLPAFSPLFRDSDRLRLHPHFCLTQKALIDTPLAARHPLHAQGVVCLRALNTTITYGELQRLAQKVHVSAVSLDELLGFLNMVGGLTVKRAFGGGMRAVGARIARRAYGLQYSDLSWRADASLWHICLAAARACRLIAASCLPVGLLVWGAGFLDFTQVLAMSGAYISIFYTSLIVHEYAHLHAIRAAATPAVILCRGFRLGLIHRPLDRRSEQKIALVGPLAGIVWCSLIGSLMTPVLDPMWTWIAIGLAGIHAGSLLPWYGDGKSVFNSRRKVQHA